MNDLKNIGQVKLITQRNPKDIQANIVYTRLGEVDLAEQHTRLDMLWCVSLHFPKLRPQWSGCMQMIHSRMHHPGVSSDIFLPIIDLTPTDPTCVRSTLEYMCDHASRHGVTPVVTFDQQLWWVAYMVIKAQKCPFWVPLEA